MLAREAGTHEHQPSGQQHRRTTEPACAAMAFAGNPQRIVGQFAGSSSVPAHVEMMDFLGMGNNPMVGASVAMAVALEQAQAK